ncbi:MAG: hypothetical protein MJ070_02200 [Lachnospiraceae bacterium]|nr:hypothetical protein [Lachnospiraceae bacterium]
MKKQKKKEQAPANPARFPDSMEGVEEDAFLAENALPDRTSHIPAMSPEWTKPTNLDDTPKPPYYPEDYPELYR